MPYDEKYILGTKINHNLSYDLVCAAIEYSIKENKRGLICTTNPEFVMKSQKDPAFQALINSSLLSIPDGFGVLIGLEFSDYIKTYHVSSRLLKVFLWFFFCFKCLIFGSRFGQTVTGVDLITHLCQLASSNGYSVFFLGGRPRNKLGHLVNDTECDLATETAKKMKKQFPQLNVVGATSSFSSDISDDTVSLKYISECMSKSNVTSIDILLVAYSFGAQEKWLARNMTALNAKIGIGVGGSFDYLSGYVSRPPIIVRRLHLEWLYRLLIHPFRVKRVFNALISFSISMIFNSK